MTAILGSVSDALDAAKKAIEEAQSAATLRHESIAAYHSVAQGTDKDTAKAALDVAQTQLDSVQAVHAAILQATGATIVHNSVIERSGIIPPQGR